MNARILVVEDEPELASIVASYLRAAGHHAEIVGDGRLALERMHASAPDLVVLDLMLPGLDGLALCRAIRRDSAVPIIMTTARVDEIDRVLGLETGADDYVCKPYSPRELVARVGAQLRRTQGRAAGDAAVAVDEPSRTVRIRGQALALTPTEFTLLAVLARRPGVIHPRAQLLDVVRRDALDVTDRAIDSHVKNLRRKLAAVGAGDLIQSVYGVGYRLAS